eukprot:gene1352-787_t
MQTETLKMTCFFSLPLWALGYKTSTITTTTKGTASSYSAPIGALTFHTYNNDDK